MEITVRCRNCKGVTHHFLIAGGKNYYQCHTGLTGFKRDGGRNPYIYPCNTVQDAQGKVVPDGALLGYISNGKAEVFRVGGN